MLAVSKVSMRVPWATLMAWNSSWASMHAFECNINWEHAMSRKPQIDLSLMYSCLNIMSISLKNTKRDCYTAIRPTLPEYFGSLNLNTWLGHIWHLQPWCYSCYRATWRLYAISSSSQQPASSSSAWSPGDIMLRNVTFHIISSFPVVSIII